MDHKIFPVRNDIPSYGEVKNDDIYSYDNYLRILNSIAAPVEASSNCIPDELLNPLSTKRVYRILAHKGYKIAKDLEKINIDDLEGDNDDLSEKNPSVENSEEDYSAHDGNAIDDDDDDFNEISADDDGPVM